MGQREHNTEREFQSDTGLTIKDRNTGLTIKDRNISNIT